MSPTCCWRRRHRWSQCAGRPRSPMPGRCWPTWRSAAPAPARSASPSTMSGSPSATTPSSREPRRRSPGQRARRVVRSVSPPSDILIGGTSRSPLEAVRARIAESARWVHDGSACRVPARSLGGRAHEGRARCARGRDSDVGDPPLVRPRLGRIRPTAGDRSRPLVGQSPFRSPRPARARRSAHSGGAPRRPERAAA